MKTPLNQPTLTPKNKPISEETNEPPAENDLEQMKHLDNKSEYGWEDDDWKPED